LANERTVGIDDLSNKDFVSNGNDFCLHLEIKVLP
jgi:hypothetical protein